MPRSRTPTPLVLAAALAACGLASAAPIYKCFDRSLGVLYTDEPCRGEVVDIRPGSPDPAALAELEREREAVSRSAAQRVAESLRPPAAPIATYAPPPEAPPPAYADYGYAYPGGYGYALPRAAHPRRGRDDGRVTIRTVPQTPTQLPHR